MKKFLSLLMVVMMLASMLTISTSAADSKLYKTMEEAKDGDLLWVVDFANAKNIYDPIYDTDADKNMLMTVGDDGRSITMTPTADAAASGKRWWGGTIKGLNIDNNSQYTMTLKIKAFGDTGKNNSTGVYGFRYTSLPDEVVNIRALGMYGNWNSNDAGGVDLQNRSALFRAGTNKSGYSNVIDTIEPDADGFITVQIEYDVKEMEYAASYMGKDGKWIEDEQSYFIFEELDDTPDEVCFLFYGYYNTSQATVKDVKFFKGVNLTPDQLAQEAPKAVETTTAAPVTTKAPETTKAPAATTAAPAATPSTADMTAVYAMAAMALTAIVAALSKKASAK